MRYSSEKGHVLGPDGAISTTGDFLVNIQNATLDGVAAPNILFHSGTKPKDSTGCILVGPVRRSPQPSIHQKVADANYPLRRMRKMFYGTEHPSATPDAAIFVDVRDPFSPPAFPLPGSKSSGGSSVFGAANLRTGRPGTPAENRHIDTLLRARSDFRADLGARKDYWTVFQTAGNKELAANVKAVESERAKSQITVAEENQKLGAIANGEFMAYKKAVRSWIDSFGSSLAGPTTVVYSSGAGPSGSSGTDSHGVDGTCHADGCLYFNRKYP